MHTHSCWWSAVSAAESDAPAAEALRTQLRAAAEQRRLLPHLLAGAMGLQQAQQQAGQQAGQVQQQAGQPQRGAGLALGEWVQRFAATVLPEGQPVHAALEVAFGSNAAQQPRALPLPQLLPLLQLAWFSTAVHVQVGARPHWGADWGGA